MEKLNTQISLEAIYNMLSGMTTSNKRWLADHLYQDIEEVEPSVVMKQKKALESSINQGWEEVKSAMEGNHNLQTADELLKELESFD